MTWSKHSFTSQVTDKLCHYFQFYPHGKNYEAASIFQKYLNLFNFEDL